VRYTQQAYSIYEIRGQTNQTHFLNDEHQHGSQVKCGHVGRDRQIVVDVYDFIPVRIAWNSKLNIN